MFKKILCIILGILALILVVIGDICLIRQELTAGILLFCIGLIDMCIAIYIHSLIRLDDYKKKKVEEENIKRDYKVYLDTKAFVLVEAFSILNNKKMNKVNRTKKLRKIIEYNPFIIKDLDNFYKLDNVDNLFKGKK